MERLLILEDGSVYRGTAFGSDNFQIGELVFNTSMTGYQEILTDNSYCGQIVKVLEKYGYKNIEEAVGRSFK